MMSCVARQSDFSKRCDAAHATVLRGELFRLSLDEKRDVQRRKPDEHSKVFTTETHSHRNIASTSLPGNSCPATVESFEAQGGVESKSQEELASLLATSFLSKPGFLNKCLDFG